MKAALYTRVSTAEQAEEGFSLAAQLDRLRSYCDSQGWEVFGHYTDDGYSAKSLERPALSKLLADAQTKHFDIVLVYKLDRLTRSVMDLYQLLQFFDQNQVSFKSATEIYDTSTAMGRLFMTLVAAIAQWERENIAERSKMGQIEMTKQGRWSGGRAPFGYDYVNGTLVINEGKAAVVKGIFERYKNGMGTYTILKWLNDPLSPQPAPHLRWTLHTVKYLLANPIYAGYVRYGYRTIQGKRQSGTLIEEGLHEPIIDKITFDHVQQSRASRAHHPARTGTGDFPLSGVLRCGLCGSTLNGVAYSKKLKNGERSQYRKYKCAKRSHSGLCQLPIVSAQAIEAALVDHLDKLSSDLRSHLNRMNSDRDPNRTLKISIKKELAKLEIKRRRWVEAYEDGNIFSSELRERMDELNEKAEQLRILQDQMELEERTKIDLDFMANLLKSFYSMWEAADSLQRKELIRGLIESVIVQDDQSLAIKYRINV